jgi:hypothetical protein
MSGHSWSFSCPASWGHGTMTPSGRQGWLFILCASQSGCRLRRFVVDDVRKPVRKPCPIAKKRRRKLEWLLEIMESISHHSPVPNIYRKLFYMSTTNLPEPPFSKGAKRQPVELRRGRHAFHSCWSDFSFRIAMRCIRASELDHPSSSSCST